MLPKYTNHVMSEAENVAEVAEVADVYKVLQRLPFADFCNLNLKVTSQYPNLKKILPIMPSDDIQKQRVGDFGHSLMVRTCSIARLIQILSFKVTGTGLEDKKILDYGCGWGRLLRIMNYFTDMKDIYGVDVVQSALDECKASHIPNQIALCNRTPTELPFGNIKFNLIFSFSVFTHIPKLIASTVLRATRKRISEDGVFIITIRSYEFWELRENIWPANLIEKLRANHLSEGYAFQYFDSSIDINENYGDTTMSFDFLAKMVDENGWSIADIERDLLEPYQIAVALKPV